VLAASTNLGETLTQALRAVSNANQELRGVFTVDWAQPAPDGSGKPLIPNEVVHVEFFSGNREFRNPVGSVSKPLEHSIPCAHRRHHAEILAGDSGREPHGGIPAAKPVSAQIPWLTGKLTGNFAESGHPPRFSSLINARIQ
jgi:hypothetical protein